MKYFFLRGKEEEDSDIEDLITSFSALEEKVLAQYTLAKVQANLCILAIYIYIYILKVAYLCISVLIPLRDATLVKYYNQCGSL